MPKGGVQYYSNIGLDDYYDQFKIEYNSRLTVLNNNLSDYRSSIREINTALKETKTYNAKLNGAKRKIHNRIDEILKVKDELLKRRKVSSKLYKDIIKLYYKAIKEEILKGYRYKLNHNLGSVVIIKEHNIKHKNSYGEYEYYINWTKTLEKREELLKTIPKEKLFNIEKLETIYNEYLSKGFSMSEARTLAKTDQRCGIKYFEYHSGDGFVHWLRWYKKSDALPNLRLYSFVFARNITRRTMALQHRTDVDGVFKFIDKRRLV